MKPKFEIGQKVYADLGDDEELVPIYRKIRDCQLDDDGNPLYQFYFEGWFVCEFRLHDNKLKFLAYLSEKIENLIGEKNETKI